MVSTSRLRHQISSDDEDENLIISYTSDAQTRSPTNEVFLKNEYGKEKTDQEIDDAAVTNFKKHQTLSGRPVKWPQQPAFVVIRFLPLYSQNTSIQYLVLYNVCIELFYF